MPVDFLYAQPGHLIRRCQQIAVAVFAEEMGGYDITPVQFAALFTVREHPGRTRQTEHLVVHRLVGRAVGPQRQRDHDCHVRALPSDWPTESSAMDVGPSAVGRGRASSCATSTPGAAMR